MAHLQVTHAFTCGRVGCFRGVSRLVVGAAVNVAESVASGCGVALRNAIQHVVGLYGAHITSAIDIGVAVGLPPVAIGVGENPTIEGRTLHKPHQEPSRHRTYLTGLPEVGCVL